MARKAKQEKMYDLVDLKDRAICVGTKSDARRLGLFTRSVHILLENNRREIIICRRPKNKKAYPDQITSSAGGHVERGESYKAAAVRELMEELGTSMPIQYIGRFDVINRTERAIHHLFVGKAKKVSPDSREIVSYRFADPKTIVRDIKKNPQKYAIPFQKALNVYLKTKEDILWIVDFDHTLFDWYRFRDNLAKYFERTLAIPISQFKAAKDKTESRRRLYNFKIHMRELSRLSGISYIRIHKAEQGLCRQLPKYVFPDSFRFLRFAQKNGTVVILTYGDDKNQKFFIKKTGVQNYCVKIITVASKDGKRLWLKKMLNRFHKIVFINDDPGETQQTLKQLPYPWKVILVERPSAKHTRIPRNKNYIVVRDLTKISALV